MSQNQIKPTHKLLHFIKKSRDHSKVQHLNESPPFKLEKIVSRSNALTTLSPLFKNQKIVSKVQRLKRILSTIKINLSKKIKSTNKPSVLKELRRFDFLIAPEDT